MYLNCIICNGDYHSLILNDIAMRQCKKCELAWRENFDISISHYENKPINFQANKIKTRIDNCKDRIKAFSQYADLNNLCDIGCGEGIFLKILQETGYTNIMGIEPSDKIKNFVKNAGLHIYKGTINDIDKFILDKNIHIITMFHVIEHLENPKKNLEYLYRSIEKGDRLIIETPDFNSYTYKKTNYVHNLIYPEHLFYFNAENLKDLLKRIGFCVLKSGKRDFDPYHLSIKECLFKLGIIQNKNVKKNTEILYHNQLQPDIRRNYFKDISKNIIRFCLVRLVILFKRQDYLWVIVEK